MNSSRSTLGAGLVALLAALPAAAQTSLDVTLLAAQNIHSTYSSVWGWTSSGGTEFAILGCGTGTSIVDVTVPAAPSEKAFITGVSSQWREMKSYDHYAYIVTEGSGGGMQIVDLATNPPSLVTTYTATFSTAHTITIVGHFAYVSGCRNSGGGAVGIRFLDLTNPIAPVDVGGWNGVYTHDCQVRGNTLYASNISNSEFTILNITNKAAPVIIKQFTWAGNSSHNADLSGDGRYLLTTDEVAGGHLHVFDLIDPVNPVQVAEWTANPGAIIHNIHIKGTLAFISYYTEGTRVVDISNPAFPVEVGYYDTWPGASGGFNGNWEVYPYAVSGNLYLSDISTGLYIVRYQATTGSVSGTVRESGGGPAIAGATVKIAGGPQTSASATGFYKLFSSPGAHTLVTTSFGFAPDSAVVSLSLGSDAPHDVDLVRLPSVAVGGVVRDAGTLATLANASITIAGTPLLRSSDGAGAYGFAAVPYGVFEFNASRFGYAPAHHTVTVTLHDPLLQTSEDFALQPAAIAHDFEPSAQGWTRVAPPNQATTGLWIWADPVGSGGGAVQPEDDHTAAPGHLCWVTGNSASPSDAVGTADIDNGATILLSPAFDLSAVANPVLSYWRFYTNNGGANPDSDTLRVEISNNGGTSWKYVEKLVQSTSQWVPVTIPVANFVTPTATMRVRFTAEDLGAGSVVECAIDDFMAYGAGLATDVAPSAVANRLAANVPNPFNPTTRIRFELAQASAAELRIYDVGGRAIRTLASGWLAAGPHERLWDGRDDRGQRVASGAYVMRLKAGSFDASRRLVLVK